MSDPIVLLHAFPLDSRLWDGLRPVLGSRLVTPDLPGFGSAAPVSEPSLDAAASAVLATLDEQGVSRAVFGGCSMGGYVTLAVLRAAPERVSGLVLINTKASADTGPARDHRHAMAARAESEGIGWLADTMLAGLLGATTLARRPHVEQELRALIAGQSPAAVAWAQRAMAARPDSVGLLAASGLPALVVRGEEDTMIPAEEADAMAGALPGAERVDLPGLGHLAPLEDPAAVAATVSRWLDKHGRFTRE
ncbi:alpha/beta hydrolase [Actinophytocola xinjiangensis]|uniref:Alpha/beta hydrolase n=1 Tax=Actinophytocola xinjiangensis TaxID=485602 RepID=A0A7Z0WJ10_9PSEU|nr:alpha/beta hydrolase [Actinophytocola xinjiangensis]OLF08119.1 alpha/beta hydrolase [Actinophytocola xinjiangensis]